MRARLVLRQRGFLPDVICAHPGWGEALFLKDVFPGSIQDACENRPQGPTPTPRSEA
ncbi:hypothetical protein [Azospirillum sp.]|uniref:hypothetical protein n=1 Tax=Azospirillum sp. TaxID=34012 RepID=UPI003417C953